MCCWFEVVSLKVRSRICQGGSWLSGFAWRSQSLMHPHGIYDTVKSGSAVATGSERLTVPFTAFTLPCIRALFDWGLQRHAPLLSTRSMSGMLRDTTSSRAWCHAGVLCMQCFGDVSSVGSCEGSNQFEGSRLQLSESLRWIATRRPRGSHEQQLPPCQGGFTGRLAESLQQSLCRHVAGSLALI